MKNAKQARSCAWMLWAASLGLAGCGSQGTEGPPGGSEAPPVATSDAGGTVNSGSGSGGGSGGGTSNGGPVGSGSGNGSSSGGSGSGASDAGKDSGGSGGEPDSGVTPATCADGLPSTLSDLASQTTGSTVSKTTPMGTNYETPAQHTATSTELTFLRDATKQPDIPASTSGLSLQAMKVTLYPSMGGKPLPADINQHDIGNCDGDTAFASMAYQNPGFIQSLIKDNGDNTYTVSMFDPMAKPMTVTVDNQFLAESGGNIGAVSGKNGVADWATVLEKATMKYNQVFHVVDDIGGIGSEYQTPMFTGVGGSFAFDRGVLQPADLTRVVKAALAAGKLISGGFGEDGKTLANGFQSVTAHGYAVLVPKDASTMISMRNPWGLDPTASGYDGSTDGVMDIPVDASWAQTIDLRIIDPGAACGPGRTTPYTPMVQDVRTNDVRVNERHATRSVRR